jgi:hypothetical protein
LPLDLNLSQEGWRIISPAGARQRGWGEPEKVDPLKLEQWIMTAMEQQTDIAIAGVHAAIQQSHGEVPEKDILEAADQLIQKDKLMAYRTPPETPDQKPSQLRQGRDALYQKVQPQDFLITRAEVSLRGWVKDLESPDHTTGLQWDNAEFTEKLFKTLRRIGSIYSRGGKTHIQTLELTDLHLKGGGRLRLVFDDVPPESMKQLGELFETLDACSSADDDTTALLEVEKPEYDCPFLKAVNPNEN